MAIPDSTLQTKSDAVAALATHLAVFTGAAGTTGASEASGSPYARQPLPSWTPSGTGSNTHATVNVPLPAGTYKEGGFFKSLSGGASDFVASAAFSGGDVMITGSGGSIDISPTIN